MTAITITPGMTHGGAGMHLSSGEPTVFSVLVRLAKLMKAELDGPALFAQGQIVCVAKASMTDGDKITINRPADDDVDFWFDVTGAYTPDGGYDANNVRVNISGATTATSVAAILAPLITASAKSDAYASMFTGEAIVHLLAKTAGKASNLPIVEAVADAGFRVAGMSGGRDADAFSAEILLHPSLG